MTAIVHKETVGKATVHRVHCPDFSDFLELIGKTSAWSANELGSRGFNGVSDSWAGGTWSQANELVKTGWPEGRQRIIDGLLGANVAAVQSRVPALRLDVAGAYPHIPMACAGVPECMYDTGDLVDAPAPIIRLYVPRAASSTIKNETLENYGIAVLSYVDALEQAGFSVEITLTKTSALYGDKNNLFDFRVVVKKAGEQLELDRMAYVLAHSTFFRRLMLAAMENSTCNQDWCDSYGVPTRLDAAEIEPGITYLPGIAYGNKEEFSTLGKAIQTLRDKIVPGYLELDGRAQA